MPKVKKVLTKKSIRVTLIALYVCLGLAATYHLVFAHRIIPGVWIGKVSVGGMNYYQATDALKNYESKMSKDLPLQADSYSTQIKASDIGFAYNWDESINNAFDVGRRGDFYLDSKEKLAALVKGLHVGAFYDYDDNALSGKLAAVKAEINQEGQNASVAINGGTLSVTPSVLGRKVVDASLYDMVVSSYSNMDFSAKTIPLKSIRPTIYEADVTPILPKISKIVQNTLTVKSGDKTWVLSPDQLLDFLTLTKDSNGKVSADINDAKFGTFEDSIAQEVNQLPRGQVTGMDGNKVTGFSITVAGKEIDADKFRGVFRSAYLASNTSVDVPMHDVSGSANMNTYGIYQLLGEGDSRFAGSIPARIKNLSLAAQRTDGVLVAPGGIYSMNKAVGDISAATGYDYAYIISGGRTVLGEGGGVCQTSTTLFRAVLNAGLPVVMRYPHAYRVGYYEQDSPVGFDATISQPSVDFRFKNDTPNYILVQSYVDQATASMSFKIFGTPDQRTVEVTQPVVTNQSPPPAPLYQDDPTLPIGTTKQVDFPAWGASVKFTRTVKKPDAADVVDTFVSNYQPWQAVYLVGKKKG